MTFSPLVVLLNRAIFKIQTVHFHYNRAQEINAENETEAILELEITRIKLTAGLRNVRNTALRAGDSGN